MHQEYLNKAKELKEAKELITCVMRVLDIAHDISNCDEE